MSERSVRVHTQGNGRAVGPLLIGVLLSVGLSARAEELSTRSMSWEPRVLMGRCQSPIGRLLVNKQPGQPWQTLDEKEDVYSRDLLLALPGTRAVIATQPAAVELTLWGNLPELASYSGLQSAVILHDTRAFDLDFTLHRGRVIIANRKEKGAALVWVRIDDAAFRLTLDEPGAAICLARYGFWPRGVPFTAEPRPQDAPARTLAFLVLKGQAHVKAGGTQHSLSAPPGAAFFHWDSDNGASDRTARRETVPDWADPTAKTPPEARPVHEAVAKYQSLAGDREPRAALDNLLAAAKNEREPKQARARTQFAVFGLAAINDLERVLQVLNDPMQAEARRAAVLALRHWIGDAPGHDQRVHRFLIEHAGYSKARATTVLQLLHSAFAADDPDTYEILIAYLRHNNLGVRELAWWHLSRLVPEGVSVPYDPAGPDAERARAYAAWKALIPSGSLPNPKKRKKD
jgi:hypothetical protein